MVELTFFLRQLVSGKNNIKKKAAIIRDHTKAGSECLFTYIASIVLTYTVSIVLYSLFASERQFDC